MTNTKPLTQEILKSKLNYDPETGVFTRTLKTGIVKVAGCKDSRGYLAIYLNKKLHYGHRLAWLYMTGQWPDTDIDHINGIKGDNRICNLREATRSQNGRNRGANKNNTSGYKGVCWHKSIQKWMSRITISGDIKFLGYFDAPEEAYLAYCEAAKEYHGEFSNTGEQNED